MRKIITLGLYLFLAATAAQAVIVAGGDGTQNTTAPAGGQGWDYVGRIIAGNGAPSSVTYLGNNWFITANHVKVLDNPTGVVLGLDSFSINAGSWTRLTNSVGTDADLMMFRVAESVGLPTLGISTSPANGTALTMIGNGRNRETSKTFWNSSWTEVTPPPPATYSGYKWASGATKRWGSNTKEADAGLVDDGFGITDMFYTDFDDLADQAQGATYDSGGGVFVDNGVSWELAGLMITTLGVSGQPGSTAVFGNRTYAADLSTYADQISATVAIPEPSVFVLASVFAVAALYIRRIFLL